jgi:thiosulfate/3-mercaptopyruvate sulfurtransferase
MKFHMKNIAFVFSVAVFLFLSGACQNTPTKVSEGAIAPWTRLTEKTKKPLKLSDDAVVLDARSDFDYGLAHWSSSVHFGWENLIVIAKKPTILVEPRIAAQRLSLLGISALTPVIAIGNGVKGAGDEGRLAWTLMYYGVEDVQTVSVHGLDVYFTHQETPARRNVSPWNASVREEMKIDRLDFIRVVTSPRKPKNGPVVHIIDVRSKEEYFSKSQDQYETPDLQALQIDWREFFGEDGRPAKGIKRKLQAVGIGLDDRVLMISNHGVRSSAASYALTALGFRHVQNFLGGWDSLLKASRK